MAQPHTPFDPPVLFARAVGHCMRANAAFCTAAMQRAKKAPGFEQARSAGVAGAGFWAATTSMLAVAAIRPDLSGEASEQIVRTAGRYQAQVAKCFCGLDQK